MSEFSYAKALLNLRKEISYNYEMTINKNEVIKKAAPAAKVKAEWPTAIKAFYSELNGVNMHWTHANFENQAKVCGKVKLLDIDSMNTDGNGLVWFEHTPIDSPLRNFKLIDFFADEAAVGFFESANSNPEMHLYLFEGMPMPLGLDLEGYIKLLCQTRGFYYWQQAILALKNNQDNQESANFKLYMPQIFPEFKFEDFAALYQSVRIG